MFPTMNGMSVEQIFDLFKNVEEDKKSRDSITDKLIEYNDEIVTIEELGEQECMDITVSGDNLFFANGILTKNSAGLPATLDLMLALIVSEQLDSMGQIVLKQLKNRFSDVTRNITCAFNIDRAKMRVTDTEDASTGYTAPPKTTVDQMSTAASATTSSPWKTGVKVVGEGKDDPFAGFQM